MNTSQPGAVAPRWLTTAVAALVVLSTAVYFVRSEGVRGQIAHVAKAASKVLAKFGVGGA